jgi:hypothetical protein
MVPVIYKRPSWTLRERGCTGAKLRCNKYGAYSPLIEEDIQSPKHINNLGTNNHLVVVPDRARNKERL